MPENLCMYQIASRVFALAATGFATQVTAIAPPRPFPLQETVVLQQDLFDRADRNSMFDWPSPPAQSGQYWERRQT
jgi:hypothetical protein